MNRELIVNVNPTEISIALCEDKVLVELNKEQCQTGFAVGDIYLGKVRKIMPGLNAFDWLVGIIGAVLFRLLIWYKAKNAKKFRRDVEYGSARCGA